MKVFAKGLMGAMALALTLWATGCTPAADCSKVTCQANQTCNPESGECETADACKGVDCSSLPGTGCDAQTGQCKNLCKLATPVTCTDPLACNPTTGKCEDLCAGKSCDATAKCNPKNGKCEAKCGPTTCTAEQNCEPTTGTCSAKCETDKKPAGKEQCAEGLKCLKTSGECVPLCTGIVCPYAQWCDDTTGTCKNGQAPAGRPGSACTGDEDCHVAHPVDGQEFSCAAEAILGDAPEGYCTATCSSTMACPQGSFCLGNACYDQCTKDSECRGGYRCQPLSFLGGDQVPAGQYLCLPSTECTQEDPKNCAPVGGDCKTEADCVSGAYCIPAEGSDGSFTGWDDGYCLWPKRKTDACPAGSTPIAGSNTDQQYQICLKSCTLTISGAGLPAGNPTSCGLGEACLQVAQNSTAGVCYQENCDTDVDCQTATCTAGDTSNCGSGQACNNGTCRTVDKCTKDADCAQGTKCDTVKGECFANYCDAAIGSCVPDCTVVDGQGDTTGACENKNCPAGSVCSLQAGGTCVVAICPEGTTCNATTKKCDRACTRDQQCGANAVCENGLCTAFCTKHNEAKVCGSAKVCGTTGHCQDKCTSDASCGDGSYCETATGHCFAKCTVDPGVCSADQLCDGSTGKCTAKCTTANELQICGQTKFCQTSSGKCLADCKGDESICGSEKCSVDASANIGICGQECNTNANCGKTPGGTQLTCQPSGNVKRCQ